MQGPSDEAVARSGFADWSAAALQGPNVPLAFDRLRFVDEAGLVNQVLTAHWTDTTHQLRWRARHDARWADDARLRGNCGHWRELLAVPIKRIETLYWPDCKPALAHALPIKPTLYGGYFGAVRDRIPLAACDTLATAGSAALGDSRAARDGAGRRWRITAPHNLAVIRSASY